MKYWILTIMAIALILGCPQLGGQTQEQETDTGVVLTPNIMPERVTPGTRATATITITNNYDKQLTGEEEYGCETEGLEFDNCCTPVVENDNECTSNDDCSDNNECIYICDETSECNADGDCQSEETCVDGRCCQEEKRCVIPCKVNDECQDGAQYCGNGYCREWCDSINSTIHKPKAKIIPTIGLIRIDDNEKPLASQIPANPDFQMVQQWTLQTSDDINSGDFQQRVRLCFYYTQQATHSVVFTRTSTNATQSSSSESGPLRINFENLDESLPVTYGLTQVLPQVNIRNAGGGYIGNMSTATAQIPVLENITIELTDNLGILRLTKPSIGDWECTPEETAWANNRWRCYGNVQLFGGNSVSFNPVIELTNDGVSQVEGLEELTERLRVSVTYSYCIDSPTYTLTVWQPGLG